MAHAFESGFFGGRQAAWHGLGTVIDEDVLTAERALILAGLDWEVELVPVYTTFNDDSVTIPDKFAVQRQTDGSALGVVGPKYQPVQNKDAFLFMDDLVDSGEAKFHTAGSLRKGQRVWMLAKIAKEIQIAGMTDERIENYLLLANSFDGSQSLSVSITPVRVVCMNTLQMALRGAQRQWRAKHTQGSLDRLEEARRALGITFKYLDTFESIANKMIEAKVSNKDFDKLLDNLIPLPVVDDPAKDSTYKSREEARDVVKALFANSPNLQNIRNTAWGAYNAVAEYSDWAIGAKTTKHATDVENRFIRQTTKLDLKDKAQTFILDQFVAV